MLVSDFFSFRQTVFAHPLAFACFLTHCYYPCFFLSHTQTDDDLLPEEFDDIWERAPKFPDAAAVEKKGGERIDVDSFVQVYRDIDDLFETEDDEKEGTNNSSSSNRQCR